MFDLKQQVTDVISFEIGKYFSEVYIKIIMAPPPLKKLEQLDYLVCLLLDKTHSKKTMSMFGTMRRQIRLCVFCYYFEHSSSRL